MHIRIILLENKHITGTTLEFKFSKLAMEKSEM